MCITFALLWLSGNASVSRGPPRFAWLDRIIKVTVCTFPYFLLVSTTTTTTTATTAATINENEKDFFWPEMRACVWASIIYSAWFLYVAVDHSACTFYVYIYISVYVYVYKIIFDYLYTYVYQVSWSPECEHVPLRSRPTSPIFALALWARWKTFIHFCMSFHHLYLSVSVFLYLFLTLFLFLSFCPSLFLIFIFLSSQWDEDAKRIIHLKALFRKTTTNNFKRVIKRF